MICVSPVTLKRDGEIVTVPCGKCIECLSRRRKEWSIRLMEEYKVAPSAHFITLTYDDKNLPEGDLLPSLCKRDMQLFIKRLRKVAKFRIRYYAVGEYGDKTQRPHYHAIIFGIHYDLNEVYSLVEDAWNLGLIHIGTVSEASVGYVTKYLISNFKDIGAREPPFSIMSRRPGLGSDYLIRMRGYYEGKVDRNYYPRPEGKKDSLPRYYRDRLYSKVERQVQAKLQLEVIDEKWREDKKKYDHKGKKRSFTEMLEERSRDRIRKLSLNKKSKL